ncbi:efflux RND transporter periplasmic adaptor subunit [Coraliomargarita sp. W4R53]
MTPFHRILNIVLLPVILIGASLIIWVMIKNKPERPSVTPPVVIPSVSYVEVSAQATTPDITTFGNVQSYFEAQLSAQVSGEIKHISPAFNSGKLVKADELLLEIDPADYLAVIAQQQANLASMQQALAEEAIRSDLASQDWTESGRSLESASDLTLRKPQLAAAQASVASAEASLQKANLDLDRTKIRAPFDAIVQSRSASPGNIVSNGSTLGKLIATEKAEVRLPLTATQVQRLHLNSVNDTTGKQPLIATLKTATQPDAQWSATITRTEPVVDLDNQVIYVIGEIATPFADPQAFLPIGSFVDATIPAHTIEDAYRIPNTSLVEDRFVWIIDDERTLQKLPVTRLVADGDDLILHIDSATDSSVLKIATRPLNSFRIGQKVKPIAKAL